MNSDHTEMPYCCERSEIGRRIRKIRLQNGLSQDKFAESISISPNFLCELENGRKGMSFDTLCRIAKTWHTTTDYLLLGASDASDSMEWLEKKLSSLSDEDIYTVIDYLNMLLKLRRLSPDAPQDPNP